MEVGSIIGDGESEGAGIVCVPRVRGLVSEGRCSAAVLVSWLIGCVGADEEDVERF